MINPEISHHGLDGWVVWPEKLLKCFVDDPVRDDEGCLLTVHYQACCGEVGPEVLPGLDGALRQLDWIGVVAIKTNVVNPLRWRSGNACWKLVRMGCKKVLARSGAWGIRLPRLLWHGTRG